MIRTIAQALAIFAFLMLLYADVQRLDAHLEAQAEREQRAAWRQ